MAFPYTPLRSPTGIRLIELQAGAASADLSCTIIAYTLEDAPPYEAVSWTWGSTDDERSLTCSSTSTSPNTFSIPITANCESMLRRVRSTEESRLLWVDAICIRQTDLLERSAQVAIMGRIYENAIRVIIDIGEASDDSDEALMALIRCSENVMYEMELGLRIRDAVGSLYERPWFHRMWVLQEAFRAKDAIVLCGAVQVPWIFFRPFKMWVDSRPAWETQHWHVELPSVVPKALTLGNCRDRTYTARADLLDLLCNGRMCASTRAVDKVFAILPMLEDALAENFHADYAKAVAQVYTETATWLLAAVGLRFLPCAQPASSTHELPSWVPDWSTRYREPWMIGIGGTYFPLEAGGKTRAVAEVVDGSILKARGILVDTIRATSGKLNIRTNSPELTEFVDQCRRYRTTDPRGPVSWPRAGIWEAETDESRLHPPDWASWQFDLPLKYPIQHSDNDLADVVTYFCAGRDLVLTERGYFGVAPSHAKTGDAVVCLLGAGVPYVLRKEAGTAESNSRYKLVGESYLYGIMNGEAMPDLDPSCIPQQDDLKPFEDFYLV